MVEAVLKSEPRRYVGYSEGQEYVSDRKFIEEICLEKRDCGVKVKADILTQEVGIIFLEQTSKR